MTKTYVVAGTKHEFVLWMESKGYDPRDKNFVYVDGIHCFVGVDDPHGFYVGSYADRADINDISMMIKERQTTISSAKSNVGILVQELDEKYDEMLGQVDTMLNTVEQIKKQYKYPVDEDDESFWNKNITG